MADNKVKITKAYKETGVLSARVTNVDDVINQLSKIKVNLAEASQVILKQQVSKTAQAVGRNVPYDSGKMVESIVETVAKPKTKNYQIGSVSINPYDVRWANGISYLYFVYYGTGSHYKFNDPLHLGRYGKGQGAKNEWWVDADKLDPRFKAIHAKDARISYGYDFKEYWQMHGQKPHPFLEKGFNETLEKNKELAIKWYNFYLKRNL